MQWNILFWYILASTEGCYLHFMIIFWFPLPPATSLFYMFPYISTVFFPSLNISFQCKQSTFSLPIFMILIGPRPIPIFLKVLPSHVFHWPLMKALQMSVILIINCPRICIINHYWLYYSYLQTWHSDCICVSTI